MKFTIVCVVPETSWKSWIQRILEWKQPKLRKRLHFLFVEQWWFNQGIQVPKKQVLGLLRLPSGMGIPLHKPYILLMAEILHHQGWWLSQLSHYLWGFNHPRWCRISAINSTAYIAEYLHFRYLKCSVKIHEEIPAGNVAGCKNCGQLDDLWYITMLSISLRCTDQPNMEDQSWCKSSQKFEGFPLSLAWFWHNDPC